MINMIKTDVVHILLHAFCCLIDSLGFFFSKYTAF